MATRSTTTRNRASPGRGFRTSTARPYYVYQYATCFASSAQLMAQIGTGSEASRAAAVERYLTLLKSGGSDHPMTLLQRAGVDLDQPETVRAVVGQLDTLVTELEKNLAA